MNTDPKCGLCRHWFPVRDTLGPWPKHGYCENSASENHKADMSANSKCIKFGRPILEEV